MVQLLWWLVFLCMVLMVCLIFYIFYLKNKMGNHDMTVIQLQQQNLQLQQQHQQLHQTFEKQLAKEVEQAKKRSLDAQRHIIKGKLGEQFAPFTTGFAYHPADCRFLGEPIDYIIFHNLHACADGLVPIEEVALVIADVKTGKAKLNKRQQILQQVILNGQVQFATLRIDEKQGTIR